MKLNKLKRFNFLFFSLIALLAFNIIFSLLIYFKVTAKHYTKYLRFANTCVSNDYNRTETSCGEKCWKCTYFLIKPDYDYPSNAKEIANSEDKKLNDEYENLKDTIGISYEIQYDKLIGKNQNCNCTILKYAFRIPK
ncbi:hypothetical protein EHQ96_18415 [Leptospira levettii]|uniref:hypothetical protein n=1 Tax=Leptospira levettii TaxID=2023178 RepID=UPI001083BC30|nr:hypothetical protein [Leptospira levettii]TGM62910.1 hypothetical protein EHQ96_18415 [Leptospira levettii]